MAGLPAAVPSLSDSGMSPVLQPLQTSCIAHLFSKALSYSASEVTALSHQPAFPQTILSIRVPGTTFPEATVLWSAAPEASPLKQLRDLNPFLLPTTKKTKPAPFPTPYLFLPDPLEQIWSNRLARSVSFLALFLVSACAVHWTEEVPSLGRFPTYLQDISCWRGVRCACKKVGCQLKPTVLFVSCTVNLSYVHYWLLYARRHEYKGLHLPFTSVTKAFCHPWNSRGLLAGLVSFFCISSHCPFISQYSRQSGDRKGTGRITVPRSQSLKVPE